MGISIGGGRLRHDNISRNTITNARGINIFDTDSVTVENNFFVNNDGGVGVFESTLNTTSLSGI